MNWEFCTLANKKNRSHFTSHHSLYRLCIHYYCLSGAIKPHFDTFPQQGRSQFTYFFTIKDCKIWKTILFVVGLYMETGSFLHSLTPLSHKFVFFYNKLVFLPPDVEKTLGQMTNIGLCIESLGITTLNIWDSGLLSTTWELTHRFSIVHLSCSLYYSLHTEMMGDPLLCMYT